MNTVPSFTAIALLFGLSFFLGLAFEESLAHGGTRRPGGIRTFPLLSLIGGTLYFFDSSRLIPFTAGLLVLGAWLLVYYRQHVDEKDEEGHPNVGLIVPLLNVYAYVLGAIAVALPPWLAVGVTVAVVLLFAERSPLHEMARRIDTREIITASQFLILTGLILPLLPNHPVTSLTTITPRQAWFALLVVCTLSYASYLAQRYWASSLGGLWMAALGGFYSSTATTVVLARQAGANPSIARYAQAGISFATGIMYLRILAIVGVFNWMLARWLAIPLCGLSLLALTIAILQYRSVKSAPKEGTPFPAGKNPLELGAAVAFAVLFVVTSLLSAWVGANFGIAGIYSLAAVIGITDIDPFVLNLAQGGTSGVPDSALAASVLIAASSNNLLKAAYAAGFGGGRATAGSTATLIGLALVGVAIAIPLGGS